MGTPEYHAWYNMIARCHDPEHLTYHRYGGRGIHAVYPGYFG